MAPSASPNEALARLIAEAGWSYAGFARRVRAEAAPGSTGARTSVTQVTRWVGGQRPRDETADVWGRVLSRRLERPVSRADMGLGDSDRAEGAAGVDGMAARIWTADAAGNELFRATPFAPELLDRPVMDWLLGRLPPPTPGVASGRPVTDYEVGRVEGMLAMFRHLDHAHGAGEFRDQAVHYLTSHLAELLARPAATPSTGTALMAVAAGMCEMVGYQAVDIGANGLAQRYYLLALGFSAAVGDRGYGSHLIAANMAHLALHTGHAQDALRLVEAAQQGGLGGTSPATRAAFCAVAARAHARLHDERATTQALAEADAALERSRPDDEPAWVRYFTAADLEDEKAHCMHDLGRHDATQQIVRGAIAELAPSRTRRLAIDTTLLATSLAEAGDLEEACAVGRTAIDYAARTNSHRTLLRVADLWTALHPWTADARVADLKDYMRATVPQAGRLTAP